MIVFPSLSIRGKINIETDYVIRFMLVTERL